jgi:hypothetical protein
MRHTRTPWAAPASLSEWGPYVIERGSKLIASADEKANAEFIVKACNGHDELVAALKAFVDQLDHEETGEPGLFGRDWIAHWEAMHEAAAKALKLAGAL